MIIFKLCPRPGVRPEFNQGQGRAHGQLLRTPPPGAPLPVHAPHWGKGQLANLQRPLSQIHGQGL